MDGSSRCRRCTSTRFYSDSTDRTPRKVTSVIIHDYMACVGVCWCMSVYVGVCWCMLVAVVLVLCLCACCCSSYFSSSSSILACLCHYSILYIQYYSCNKWDKGVTNMYQQVSHRCVALLANKIMLNQKDPFLSVD